MNTTFVLAKHGLSHYFLPQIDSHTFLATHDLYVHYFLQHMDSHTIPATTQNLTRSLATHGLYTVSCNTWILTLFLATHGVSHHPLQHMVSPTIQLYKVTHYVLTYLLTYGLLTASLATQKNSRALHLHVLCLNLDFHTINLHIMQMYLPIHRLLKTDFYSKWTLNYITSQCY